MFVLLQWNDSKKITVMEESTDLEKKNEGETVEVLYGNTLHKGILIKRSGKRNFFTIIFKIIKCFKSF